MPTSQHLDARAWDSHRRAFHDVLEYRNPQSYLEWGGGEHSTRWAAEAKIPRRCTIEHDQEWFDKLDTPYKLMARLAPGEPCEYTGLPMSWPSQWDFIVVDGRERVRCLETASIVLQQPGIVLVHDTYRAKYWEGMRWWPYVRNYPQECTVLLSHWPISW